jgi:hydroxyacylglutathione hydrolase
LVLQQHRHLLSKLEAEVDFVQVSVSAKWLHPPRRSQFPCLNDNYGYLLHDPTTGATAAIDTPFSPDYKRELETRNWELTDILNTHHHHDHTGGNLQLKEVEDNNVVKVKVTGPQAEASRIPGIDHGVQHGDKVSVGNLVGEVIDVGGHTNGHIAYYFPSQKLLFCGDALFALGCGRMFEGTPDQFWNSLQRLRNLPDDTIVYCAHEYTQSNAKFALSVEPSNPHLQSQAAAVNDKRSRNEPTVPTLLGDEKKANPFLRIDISDEIRRNVGVTPDDTPAQAFGKLRKAKDRF